MRAICLLRVDDLLSNLAPAIDGCDNLAIHRIELAPQIRQRCLIVGALANGWLRIWRSDRPL
jgi:hypothetical protein